MGWLAIVAAEDDDTQHARSRISSNVIFWGRFMPTRTPAGSLWLVFFRAPNIHFWTDALIRGRFSIGVSATKYYLESGKSTSKWPGRLPGPCC